MGFMKKEKIINKVKTYLTENRINFEEGTIEYIGIRENYEIEPGNPPLRSSCAAALYIQGLMYSF